LQRVQQDAGSNNFLTAMPEPDPSRPHVFMDITVDNKPAGLSQLFTGVCSALTVQRRLQRVYRLVQVVKRSVHAL
jgi:hypothetical protein